MKKLLLLVPIALFAAGCNSGDTPTETYPTKKTQTDTQTFSSGIQNNPNLPDAAKKAILNQNRPK